MSQIISIQNSTTNEVIASGSPTLLEGNYYFDKDKVNTELLVKKDKMYHCPIKNADADYYYLVGNEDSEIGWCYEDPKNKLYDNIAGKIAFYGNSKPSIQIIKEEN